MRAWRAGWVVSVLLALTACSSSSSSDDVDDDPVPTPAGFVLPAGITLSEPGTSVKVNTPRTLVVDLGGGTASAVTTRVTAIRQGDMATDFRFFSLDEETAASTPYYVDVQVRNEGPAGLGGSGLPFFAHDSENTIHPPTQLVGQFEPCPAGALPESFLPTALATLCYVYLLPAGRTLESIDLQTGTAADAFHWTP